MLQYAGREVAVADLKFADTRVLEEAFRMSGGDVINFSNRTFAEFFSDCVGIDILDEKYAASRDSKANRLRHFWKTEENHLVGKVISELIQLADVTFQYAPSKDISDKTVAIANRLLGGMAVEDIAALQVLSEERAFQLLSSSVRDAIDDGKPEAALDRLHTYCVKYIRQVCQGRNIDTAESKPIHALVGEYTKALKADGTIESEITERILKNSIGMMELFNTVRNRQSLAHDNQILGSDESLLIVNHVVSIIRFIQKVER